MDGNASAPVLLREDKAGIATITLNRPAALNALSEALMGALQEEFDAIAVDRSVRVVILRAEGRAFCAGHDLREMESARASADKGRAYFNTLFGQCSRLMTSITRLPQPVIAQVHALATAAGCQLVASCDMAVAADHAKFGVNGVNIGLFCSTPMVALTRNVARKHAFEMLTTGEFIEASRAAEIGLVNRVVPADDLDAETRALAEKVAGKLAAAVHIGKRAFYEQAEMTLDAAYAHTGRVMAENMLMRDTAEGIQAFLEKRQPDWK
jgi:enoyl-CoA hydratase/carnithine racemase